MTPTSTGGRQNGPSWPPILLTAALAPTNVPLLNPDVLSAPTRRAVVASVKGLGNISRDILTNKGFPRSVNRDAFAVGRDLAVTPGAVVFRNEVCELLQYTPTTETVHSVPLVLVPPQINKYYFMDLAPGRSFVEYCVQQGLQMFAISWRNPTEEHRDWGLDTYVDAVHEALRAACEIAGTEQANTVSLCAGGITTAALLGHLASTQDTLINCATFAVTLLDFTVPTMIGLLASPAIVDNSLRSTKRGGVLPGIVRHCALLPVAPQRPHLELLGPQQSDGRGAADLRRAGLELPTPPACPPRCTPTFSTCSCRTRWPPATSWCTGARST